MTDSRYPDSRPPAPTLDERLGWTRAGWADAPVVVTEIGQRPVVGVDPASSDTPGAVVIAEPLWDGTFRIVSIDPDQAAIAELMRRVSARMQEFADAFREAGQAMFGALIPFAEQLEREQARAEVATIEANARLQFRAEGDRCAPLQAVRFDASGLPIDEGPDPW